MFRSLLCAVGGSVVTILSSHGAFTVNPPQAITHRVEVQPIIVSKTNGATAVFMGHTASEAYIKGRINQAWAQVGVEISWLAPVSYTNNFAYDGSPNNYSSNSRPQSHLDQIVDNAGTPPKNPDSIVLNLFFVEIVPGFSQTPDNAANGLAFVDDNGSAIHVGAFLVADGPYNYTNGGRDVAAAVIAHEIGHCLGLSHYSSSSSNLMYGGSGSGERLIESQKNTIFTNNWWLDGYDMLQVIPEESNFVVWADGFGIEGGPDDDDDGDRLSNAFEFLNGTLPNSPNSFPPPVATAAGPVWSLAKNPLAVEDGFDFEIETSPTLDGWLPAGSNGSGSTVLFDTTDAVSVRLNSGAPSAFLRVGVSIPEIAAATVASVAPPEAPERVYSSCATGGCGCQAAVAP
ncbi:peptidase M10A and M12B matrixin and adamalysin [Haloferula helveola]|uniref:Peptidase M10A and M12B matrixin and adamalysin n=1 Tax=Haloferula helveola TaxID=490095 RepID=A0ABM7RF91_9BACT|nr:peptidase M10A and M12B matrixin and adamalysin [Haloferula helveola]